MEGLRPLGVGELIDAAIRICRAQFGTLVAAVAVPILPTTIITALLVWSAMPDVGTDPETGVLTVTDANWWLIISAGLLILVLWMVATSVATAACFRSISTAYVGGSVTWQESLRFGFQRLGSVVGLSLLVGVITTIGFLFCLAPGVWAYGIFALAMPALLVEGLGATAAMDRSRQLVAGMFWRCLGVVLLSGLLAAAAQQAVTLPMTLVADQFGSTGVQVATSVFASLVGLILTQPFSAAMTMALYVDQRVRKEGFDLTLWAQRLGAEAPEGGFPAQPGAGAAGPGPVGWAPRAPDPVGPPDGGYPPLPGRYPAPTGFAPPAPPPPPPPPPPPAPAADPPPPG